MDSSESCINNYRKGKREGDRLRKAPQSHNPFSTKMLGWVKNHSVCVKKQFHGKWPRLQLGVSESPEDSTAEDKILSIDTVTRGKR